MKKMSLLVVFVLVAVLPGCYNKQNKESERSSRKNNIAKYMDTEVDVEDLDEDEDMDEMADEEAMEEIDLADLKDILGDFDEDELTAEDLMDIEFPSEESEDYSWIDAQTDDEFRKLYFSFNHYGIRADQKAALHYDIEQVKQLIAEAGDATVVIEGHACQEGAPAYNLALSERRAKAVADLFVAAGVERSAIKVVGRGQECPVISGRTREDRAPNRRVEVRVIYT